MPPLIEVVLQFLETAGDDAMGKYLLSWPLVPSNIASNIRVEVTNSQFQSITYTAFMTKQPEQKFTPDPAQESSLNSVPDSPPEPAIAASKQERRRTG
jgi:hypothetical protein